MNDIIGKTLGEKYRIIRLIGRGGMGIVYEAEHLVLGKRVALKVLLPMYASKTHSIRRFIREGRAASAIDHPNILDIKDLCQDPDGSVYIVMELLRGQSLKQLLDQRRVLPLAQTIHIMLEVLSGLQAAHARGVIHRDLKPENIFISSVAGKEHVKIVDFGIAKFMETAAAAPSLTVTGSVPGTPYYMAPELAKGSKIADEQTDIWSLGVVMYEMLTGNVPFGGDNYNEVISQILLTPVQPVRDLSADVPVELAAVVHKALAKDKQDRYKSAHEMVEALLPLKGPDTLVPRTTDVLNRTDNAASNNPLPVYRPVSEPDLMDMTFSRPSRLPPGASRKRYVIAAAAAALSALLFFAFTGNRTAETDDRKVPREFPANVSAAATPPLLAEPAAAPGPVVPQAPIPEAEAVNVDLNGLPADPEITLNGRHQTVPIQIPKSEEAMELEINAKGYLPYRRQIVPSSGLSISVSMQKIPERAAKLKKREPKKAPKGDKPWRSNPFSNE